MFKRVKQKIALLGLSAILLCGMIYSPANAAEPLTNQEQSEALYDMKKGGTQEFDVITDNGEKAHVTITEIPNTTKVANGTYRIQYDLKGCWVAGFYVKVSNNSILSANNPFCTVKFGYISNAKLIVNSSKMATYSYYYHTGAAYSYTGVRATISGTTLKANIL